MIIISILLGLVVSLLTANFAAQAMWSNGLLMEASSNKITASNNIPAPAVAAGFTTLVADFDFTGSTYNTPSKIVAECGATGAAVWHWLHQYTFNSLNCSDIAVTSDGPSNPQVLQITMTISEWANSFNNEGMFAFPWGVYTPSNECNVYTAGCLPNNLYYEITWRLDQTSWTNDGSHFAHYFHALTGRGYLPNGTLGQPNDWLESVNEETTGFGPPPTSGATYDINLDGGENGSVCFSCPTLYTNSYDATNYHTISMIQTSDGNGLMWKCALLDGVTVGNPQTDGNGTPPGCASHTNTNIINQHDNIVELSSGCCYNQTGAPTTNTIARIKRVRIFSCPSFATNACTVPQTPGGALVTHWP